MTELPPLPPMSVIDRHLPTGVVIRGYTADQMRAYAAAAVAKERERFLAILNASVETTWREAAAEERERCAQICEELEAALWREYKDGTGPSSHTEGRSDGAGECAAAIRATPATPQPPAAS